MLMTRAPTTAAADDLLLTPPRAWPIATCAISPSSMAIATSSASCPIATSARRSVTGAPASSGGRAGADGMLRVAHAMTPDVFVVRQDAPFADVVRVFTDQRVGAVPVVDDGERLVGIISYVDVFKNAGAL